jgi:hypothetical protein
MYRWDTGTPLDSTDVWDVQIPTTERMCIFSDGPLEIRGHFSGQVTIGSAADIRLIDDIVYDDAQFPEGRPTNPEQSRNLLGIVSEGNVVVANTIENGRNNSSGRGLAETRRQVSSITITAAIVALGESFTFEQQNDPNTGYLCIVPCGCTPDGRGGGPDDRGTIYLYGSLTQMRRGYVHRSNCSSTGYLKHYRYDKRFLTSRPPCFFDISDEDGRALFNVVQWGQGYEFPPDVEHSNVVRYN